MTRRRRGGSSMAQGGMNACAQLLRRKLTPRCICGCRVPHRVQWAFDIGLNRAPVWNRLLVLKAFSFWQVKTSLELPYAKMSGKIYKGKLENVIESSVRFLCPGVSAQAYLFLMHLPFGMSSNWGFDIKIHKRQVIPWLSTLGWHGFTGLFFGRGPIFGSNAGVFPNWALRGGARRRRGKKKNRWIKWKACCGPI